jgi:pimeloyl-ACP methyl ester carboxylesterase
MGKSGIFQPIRRGIWLCGFSWFAGFAVVRAVADEPAGAAGAAPVPVTAAQARLKEMFPETYTKAVAEFGWRQYQDGKRGGLQERLPQRVVVLVHGIDEPGKLWMNMAPAVVQAGYAVCEFRYPNDQPVRPSAAYLLHSLCELRARGATAIVIVAHSMGGLVSREMLTNPQMDYAGSVQKGQAPAVRHLIMLCTPNHGSPLAHARFAVELRDQGMRLFNGNGNLLSGFVDGTGEAGKDLVPESEFLQALNARPNPPDVALSIVAGIASPISREGLAKLGKMPGAGKPDTDQGGVLAACRAALESLADGVGDGCVSVSSARLDGVADFVTVAGTHLSTVRNVLESSNTVPPAVPLVLERLAKDWPLSAP